MDTLRRPISILEYGFAFFGILLVTDALYPLYGGAFASVYVDPTRTFTSTASNWRLQLLSGSIYLVSLILLIHFRKTAADAVMKNKGLLLFIGFIVLSSAWAIDPPVSFRRAAALVGTTIFAFYLGIRFPPRKFISLLAVAMVIVVFEDLFVALLLPDIGLQGSDNWALRGLHGHKNNAARIFVMAGLVIWIAGEVQREVHRAAKVFSVVAVILTMGLVFWSKSATSLVVMLSLIVGMISLKALRRSSVSIFLRTTLIILIVVVPAAFLLSSNYGAILDLLGKDETLTGRTKIWERAIEIGRNRPWLGFGYRSFWIDIGPTRFLRQGHGHNSFLDLFLELGLIGMSLFAVTYVTAFRRAFWRLTASQDSMGVWYISFLFALTLWGITGQVFPDHGTLLWVLYVSLLVHLAPSSQPAQIAFRARSAPI